MQSLFLNDRTVLFLTEAECLFYFLNGLLLISAVSACILLYRFLRPRLPSRVNCWFCNRTFFVPYENRHCFDCRYCDQYNGFNSDGDYNIDVVRQKKINNVVYAQASGSVPASSNGLCKSCNVNQQLKVQQLAGFTAMNENNYNAEIEHFRQQLEKCYKLCDACELTLTQKLQTVNYDLLTQRLNGHCPGAKNGVVPSNPLSNHVNSIYNGSTAIMGLLSLYSCLKTVDYFMQMNLNLPWFGIIEISALGTILSVAILLSRMQDFDNRDVVCLASWGLVHSVTWTGNISALLLTTALGLLVHLLPRKKKIILVPVKKSRRTSKTPLKSANTIPNSATSTSETPTKVNKKVTDNPVGVEEEAKVTSRIVTRSQKKKSEVPEGEKVSKDETRKSRLHSPPPEVYDGFNRLRLSSPGPEPAKRDKPANYLFESLQIETGRPKDIIKPAKFFGNGNLASPYAESVAPSRTSCTPHSDIMPDYAISTLSPVSHKYSPANSYHVDYDLNPYTAHPGFFPMPLSHSTVFTYARPASYPYQVPFGPMRYSPTFASPCDSFSTRLSDVSQEASFESINGSRKWLWVKRAFFVGSIILNSLSIGYLIYSYWRG